MPTNKEHSGRGRKATKTGKQARSRPTKGNMRKTTKKGAYAKNKKKALAIRRNPIVEQKTRVLSDIWQMNGHDADPASGLINPTNYHALMAGVAGSPIYSTGIFNLLPLHNYTCMFQAGRLNTEQSNRMVGTNIFAKYLNVKGRIRWPVGDDIARLPQNLQLIWGYTNPAHYTSTTVPAVGGLMPQNLTSHIVEQIGEFFNAQVDELQFKAKRESHVTILGKKWIKPKQGEQYTAVPNQHTTTTGIDKISGVVPDSKFNISFELMRKTHYDAGGLLSYAGTTDQDQCYNLNDHKIPFVIFYQPDENVLGGPDADKRPSVAYNSILYYTDS